MFALQTNAANKYYMRTSAQAADLRYKCYRNLDHPRKKKHEITPHSMPHAMYGSFGGEGGPGADVLGQPCVNNWLSMKGPGSVCANIAWCIGVHLSEAFSRSFHRRQIFSVVRQLPRRDVS